MSNSDQIGLLGFGEVGSILGADLPSNGEQIAAFDLKFSDPSSAPCQAAKAAPNIAIAESAIALAESSHIVFSAVTAEETESAARSVSEHLPDGAWFIDLNSASPKSKQRAANCINAAGGRYVEVAVMSPVPPKRLGTPLLLGGPFAREFLSLAAELGWSNTRVYSDEYGQASAAKMCRSVMVKGVEALLVESLVTARSYGVEDTVLESLDDLFPGPDWPALARYMISRTLLHGGRRAQEMREVAKTVSDVGLSPNMSLATVAVQDWSKHYPELQDHDALGAILDALGDAAQSQIKGNTA